MTGRDKHFLVLESNPDDAFLIRRAFRALPYCSCFVCRNSGEAQAYLLGSGMYSDRGNFPLPSAIITELRLGLEAGESFIEWLHKQSDFQIPVMVLAGAVSKADADALARLNISKVLTKSGDINALRETLVALAKELCST